MMSAVDRATRQRAYRQKAYLDQLAVWRKTGGSCGLCRRPVLSDVEIAAGRYGDKMRASVDHIVPLSLEGANTPDNFRLVHRRCNYSRGTGRGNRARLQRIKQSHGERSAGF